MADRDDVESQVESFLRARFYERDKFAWNIRRVPQRLEWTDETGEHEVAHPARTCGIFVVHGIGEQAWTDTAATIRSGFEKAAHAIRTEREARSGGPDTTSPRVAAFERQGPPPPFAWDGFWADYADLKETFPEDWRRFARRERLFFSKLWALRVASRFRTLGWFVWQGLRLLRVRPLREFRFLPWLLYIPLQPVLWATLGSALIWAPRIISGFLEDVRLYLDPRGIVERAIVQRIDLRVASKFLQMIGLDTEFRPLPRHRWIRASGRPIRFHRVVWVAHSLGTVISYNVLSDLFVLAADCERNGDEEQKEGVRRFRRELRRFITLGSPLDKVAFLFGEKSLRAWPDGAARRTLLTGGEHFDGDAQGETEFWVNFYHVLDPVSGALSSPAICSAQPPANFHIDLLRLPGLAHVAYWSDVRTIRYIGSRTYGMANMPDEKLRARSPLLLTLLAAFGYSVWATIILAALLGLVDGAWRLLTGEHLLAPFEWLWNVLGAG